MLIEHASPAQRSLEGLIADLLNQGAPQLRSARRASSVSLLGLTNAFPWHAKRDPQFNGVSVAVMHGEPFHFVCPSAVRVVCSSGTAWLTAEYDVRDVVLGGRQVHIAAAGTRLFISGLPECRLRIEPMNQRDTHHAAAPNR